MLVMVINCGSSSVKYKLFRFPEGVTLSSGIIERIGEAEGLPNHRSAISSLFANIKSSGCIKTFDEISVIGHRVVHGGETYREPIFINQKVIAEIRKNSELAPLHNPANLEGILACRKILPQLKQVAVFDTAFFSLIPDYAYLYALPYEFYAKYRIRRYGFHGTSHQYVSLKASQILRKSLRRLKLITVHLGNGCSISAVDRGRCIDTSMGFTPLEGLIMGTRAGDIDAGVVFYLAKRLKLSFGKIENILNKKSGLLGISGVSNDVREIKEKARRKNKRAQLSLEMFCYRVRKYISSYIGLLSGVDALIFTGGIGENNPDLVKMITHKLFRYLKKKPEVLIIPTDEEFMIAQLSYRLIKRR